MLGFYAFLVVLPHQLDDRVLRLWYGYISEVTVPRAGIRGVCPAERPEDTKRKLVIDPAYETGCYTSGGRPSRSTWNPRLA